MLAATPELLAFLHATKVATYASQSDEASVTPALPDSRQLEYSRGPRPIWQGGWTLAAARGNLPAQYEHTMIITKGDPVAVTQH